MQVRKEDGSYYVKLFVMIVLMFGAQFVPAAGYLSSYGTTIVGIFIGVIFGYLFFGMTMPSFLALIALGFSGYDTVAGTLRSSIGNSIVLYTFAILIFSQVLQDSGLADRMINWLVTTRICKGRPWALSGMLMMTAFIVSLLVNFVPPCIIIWGMLMELFPKIGYKPGDKWPMIMLAGVLYMSTMGGFVAPFQTGVVANFGILKAATGGRLSYNYVTYFIWAFLIGCILLALWLLFAKYILRPDVSPLEQEDLFERNHDPLTGTQELVAILFTIFVVGLFLPSMLPDGNFVKSILTGLDNCGWGLLMVLVAISIRSDGKNLFDFGTLFARGVFWDLPAMMACVFTISAALTDPTTGLPDLMRVLVEPLMDKMSLTAFWLLIIFIVLLAANLTNTLVITCTIIPIMATVAGYSSMNLVLFTACVNFIGNVCLISPACCMNAAMLYGQKEWLNSRFCLMFGLFVFVTMYVTIVAVGLPLGNLLL